MPEFKQKRKGGYALLALALLLIILGILQGDYTDILRRTTTICLECAGIG